MISQKPFLPVTIFFAQSAGLLLNWVLVAGTCLGQTNPAGQQAWLTPEAMRMPREQISKSLSGAALRLYTGRGYVAIREMTVTGIQQLCFHPLCDLGYRFNLAFREEATGTLIQDLQDEGGDPLGYNLSSAASNKLGVSRGGPDGWTWVLLSQDALWQPNCVTRTGTFHKFVEGQMVSFGVKSRTSVSFEADEIYEELEIENRMGRPLALALIPDQHANPRRPASSSRVAVFKLWQSAIWGRPRPRAGG